MLWLTSLESVIDLGLLRVFNVRKVVILLYLLARDLEAGTGWGDNICSVVIGEPLHSKLVVVVQPSKYVFGIDRKLPESKKYNINAFHVF